MKILARTPSRASLFGGGTDLDSYASAYGGMVLAMAINLRCQTILYTDDDIWEKTKHDIPYDADPALLYEILGHFNLSGMHHTRVVSFFDGFISAGLGSSASFTVSLIGAIAYYLNRQLSRDEIAQLAWRIEVHNLNWYGGKQDQYTVSHGGMNIIEFGNKVTITSIKSSYVNKLLPYLLLCYTGGMRHSSSIQKGFSVLSNNQIKVLHKMKKQVIHASMALFSGDIETLGMLLDEAWEYKKESNLSVTNRRIDDIYAHAKKHGALGGKLVGAGGSGYMLFVIAPDKRENLIAKLREKAVEDVDFGIDLNGLEVRRL